MTLVNICTIMLKKSVKKGGNVEKTRQTLGANIAKFRKLKNLTQGELACKLGFGEPRVNGAVADLVQLHRTQMRAAL